MDVNTLRVAVMLAGFVLFVALMVHTYSKRRQYEHDEAARLPLLSSFGADEHPMPTPGAKP